MLQTSIFLCSYALLWFPSWFVLLFTPLQKWDNTHHMVTNQEIGFFRHAYLFLQQFCSKSNIWTVLMWNFTNMLKIYSYGRRNISCKVLKFSFSQRYLSEQSWYRTIHTCSNLSPSKFLFQLPCFAKKVDLKVCLTP